MFFGWILFGALIGVIAAKKRGFGTAGGVLGGLLLGPAAVLMFLVSSEKRRCPECDEWISMKAKTCPLCQTKVEQA